MPTQAEVREFITKLNDQHPNPWTRGVQYPAINPATGKQVFIERSTQQKTGVHYLHIYMPVVKVIKSPTGEVLSRTNGFSHFRANMRTFELVQVD